MNNVKSYSDFINEKEQKVVYPTNFSGMVQGAVSSIHSQVMAIAQELANEKLARNPYRYEDADKVGGVEEVDITRALNLIFHFSDHPSSFSTFLEVEIGATILASSAN